MAKQLAILCTHPIQYYAPVFRRLSEMKDLRIKVFYGWEGASQQAYDPGFGQSIQWDIPLLEDYDYEFVPNVAKKPGSDHFNGIDLPTLHQRIDGFGPDALLVYGWCYKSHLRALHHYHGHIPVLFRGDSTLLDEKPGLKTLVRRLVLRWVYQHVDIALYVGSQNRRYFKVHGLADKQLVFAPHAIDNERFSEAPKAKDEALLWRQRLGITNEEKVLLFVGKFEPKKGPDLLLDAFLSAKNSQMHLVFVGSGILEESLKEKANARVHFLGFHNQTVMPVIYRIGDVIVLPSRGPGETWGLALNEAMACGKAVIASNKVGAAVDLVVEDQNGWIFNIERNDDLDHCVQGLLHINKAKLLEIGQCSRNLIASWSLEKQIAAIADVCQNIV
ncbi:MAG: glycosyltransferase family 4 protein [Methylococcaceae bacterium]